MQLTASSRAVPHSPLSLPLVNISQKSEQVKPQDSALRLLRPIVAPVKTIPCLRQGEENINTISQNRQKFSVPERSWMGFFSEKVAPIAGVENPARDALTHEVGRTMVSIDHALAKIQKNDAFLSKMADVFGKQPIASAFALGSHYKTIAVSLMSKQLRVERLEKECQSLQALCLLYQESLKSPYAEVMTLKHRHQNVAQKLTQLHTYLASLESEIIESDAPDVFYLLASFAHRPEVEISDREMAENVFKDLVSGSEHPSGDLGLRALTGLKQHYLHHKIGYVTEMAYRVQKDLRSLEETLPLHQSERRELDRIKSFFNQDYESIQSINQTLESKESLNPTELSQLLDSLIEVEQAIESSENLIAQIDQSPRPVHPSTLPDNFLPPVEVIEPAAEGVAAEPSELSFESSSDAGQQRSMNPLRFLWRCLQFFNTLRFMGHHHSVPASRESVSRNAEAQDSISALRQSEVDAEPQVENHPLPFELLSAKENKIQDAIEALEGSLLSDQALALKVKQGITDARLRHHFGNQNAFAVLGEDAEEMHQLSTEYVGLLGAVTAEKTRISTLPANEQLAQLDRLSRLVTDLSDNAVLLREQLQGSFVPMLFSAWQSFSVVDSNISKAEIKDLLLSAGNEEFLSVVRQQTLKASIDFLKPYHAYTKTLLARQQPITETERRELTSLESHLAGHLEKLNTLQSTFDDPCFSGQEGYDRFEYNKESLLSEAKESVALADDVIWQLIQRLPTAQEAAEFQYTDLTSQKALAASAQDAASAQKTVAAVQKIQGTWRAYQESPQQVTLSMRPLSRGTLKKKLRNLITEGKPIHTSVIASAGRSRPVNHIFTAQETAGQHMSVSHIDSDVATRDKQAWMDAQAPVLTRVLPLPVSTFTKLSKQMKARDSALGQQNMRTGYVEMKSIINHWTAGKLLNIPILNTLVALPNNCQTHVSRGLNDIAGVTNLKYEYLIQNGLVQPDRFRPVTQEAFALPKEAYLLGWSFGLEKPA